MAEKPEVKSCFVVGPIGAEGSDTRIAADWLLKGVIKPVMEEYGFLVRRADEIPEPGMIDSQVITNVLDADLVIADLSEHNANAFYELAIRHMVQKPIIHMIDKKTDIPFDVKPFRAIQFSTRAYGDLELAKEELRRQVSECIKSDHRVDNPVTRARGRMELLQTATPRDQVILETLEGVSRRLDQLERGVAVGRATKNALADIYRDQFFDEKRRNYVLELKVIKTLDHDKFGDHLAKIAGDNGITISVSRKHFDEKYDILEVLVAGRELERTRATQQLMSVVRDYPGASPFFP